MSSAGYSGKPLSEKLGIKPGSRVLVINAPVHYAAMLGSLAAQCLFAGEIRDADILHLFAASRADLARTAGEIATQPKSGAAIWVSWPKKSSPLFADLTENGVREIMLPTGWVDVKVCAIDADWSGLKFLRRKRPV